MTTATTTDPTPSPHPVRAAHWDFFWLLVKRDLKTRYAGSALGGIWNLIHPVAMILIYIAVFSSLFKNRGGSANAPSYAAHLCSGMLVWLVFSDVLGRSVTVLTDNGNFLQKIWFPPALLHASVLFNVLLVYGAGLIALWLCLAALGHRAPAAALLAFPIMGLAGIAASGLGMALSALHVFFRDTSQVIMILLQVGFWFNPIVYHREMIVNSSVGNWSWILDLNPVAHFVAIAQSLFGDPLADPRAFAPAVVAVFPILCVLAGAAGFKRMLTDVRDAL